VGVHADARFSIALLSGLRGLSHLELAQKASEVYGNDINKLELYVSYDSLTFYANVLLAPASDYVVRWYDNRPSTLARSLMLHLCRHGDFSRHSRLVLGR